VVYLTKRLLFILDEFDWGIGVEKQNNPLVTPSSMALLMT
jgi:hypothetical protein